MSDSQPQWLIPDWQVPARVHALSTTVWAGNLATHAGVHADEAAVHREALRANAQLPSAPRWLAQEHGPLVVHADDADATTCADGAWTSTTGVVCAVLTADCLPVLFCDREGRYVAAAHAGWRGLCSGVLDLTVQRFFELDVPPEDIRVWLGPAIGAAAYEVDAQVHDAFMRRQPDCTASFSITRAGHWQFDLYAAARTILQAQGVQHCSGGTHCTYTEPQFFSHRQDANCGRQATLIWLA